MRLNKVAKELNVGINTLVEFLEKKGGDPNMKWTPMSNVTDEQLALLTREFNKDKSVKEASERERQERMQTRDKIKEESRLINAVNSGIPQSKQPAAAKEAPAPATSTADEKLKASGVKILGHIDLDAQKKPAQPKPAQTPNKPKEQPKPAQQPKPADRQKPAEQQKPAVKPAEKPVQKPKEQPKPVESKPAEPKPAEPKPAAANTAEQKKPNQTIWGERSKDRINDEPLPAEAKNGEVFRLEQKNAPQLNVVGSIDLDALNQSTRPKKKSKEERKKEREQKNQQGNGRNGGNDEARGSRRQHGAQKVDINEEINRGKARDAKGQERRDRKDQMDDNRGRKQGKDKKKGNQAYKQEINEIDVQQQVKDTLARLTNKPDKKSVKYRKDKRNAAAQAAAEAEEAQAAQSKVLKLTEFVTANDLATMMNVSVIQVISTCMSLGMMVSINQRLEAETIDLVASEFGFETQYVSEEVEAELEQEADTEDQLQSRPPIITVMVGGPW